MARYQPCKDCTKRQLYCHSNCEDYKKFLEELNKIKAGKNVQTTIQSARTKHVSNTLSRRKGKWHK